MSKKRDLTKAKLQQLQLQNEDRAAFKRQLQEGTVIDLPYSSMYIQKSQLYFLMKNIKFWVKDDSIKLEYQKVRRAFINQRKTPFSCYVIRERIDYFDQNKLLKLLSEEYTRLIPDEGDSKVLESGQVPQLPANCVQSDDWSNIKFLNSEIVMLHDGRQFSFKWKDSLKDFQAVHACLRHVKLPYGFVLDNGKITKLFIEDRDKRQQLTSNGAKDLFGISKVTRINHSLSKANYDNWWDKLKRILV